MEGRVGGGRIGGDGMGESDGRNDGDGRTGLEGRAGDGLERKMKRRRGRPVKSQNGRLSLQVAD